MYWSKLCLALATIASVSAQFGSRENRGRIDDANIDEASGIAVSYKHPHVLYVHNDKGDSSRFFAVDINNGHTLATFNIRHARNYDWEDMAYGPCADDCARLSDGCSAEVMNSPAGVLIRYCLYFADIGNHGGDGAKNIIYMVREPSILQDGELDLVDTVQFSWSAQDAETLMVDPTGMLYVISKSANGRAIMAAIPRTAWGGPVVQLGVPGHSDVALLKVTSNDEDPKGGSISPDGKEMLLLYNDDVYHYSINNLNYLQTVNNTLPERLPNYHKESDTESISWDPHGTGFYTISEGKHERIYYYPKTGPVVG